MIVVTGGAGFIGSNLLAGLEARGARGLVVCDRLGTDEKWRNIAKRDIAHIVAPPDLLDFLSQSAAGVDAVIHMGAAGAAETEIDRILRDNFHFSADIWAWCAQNGVRLIYAAGGGSPEAAARPVTPQDWSRNLFDRAVARTLAAGSPQPPQWAGLSFFDVYGPNEYHKGERVSAVLAMWRQVAAGGPAVLSPAHDPAGSEGVARRDFVWVGDCVDVVLWLLDNPAVGGQFDVGTGNARSFAEVAGAVCAAVGREPDIAYVETPLNIPGESQYSTEANVSGLRGAGYEAPFTALEDGVSTYVRDFLATPDPYA